MDFAKKRKADDNGIVVVPTVPGGGGDADFTSPRLAPEDVLKIIEPLPHDQLLEILQNAAVRHFDVLDAVRSIADRDPTQRKLFIRGLGWDTTTEKLSALFSSYGELEEAVVILDKVTSKSKGYGFVTFKHVDGALLALKEPSKKIDGRMTVTQLAVIGNAGAVANPSAPDVAQRKIYVANVPPEMPADRLLAHFSSYGEIEEGPLGFDKQTGKSRGFALFVFKTAQAAKDSLVDPAKIIDGHQIVCKLAIDGKKGKLGGPGTAGPGGVQGPGGVEPHHGNGQQTSMQPGSHYGGPIGPGSGYNAFSGGHQGQPPLGHHHHGMNSAMPSSLGGASGGGQPPPSSYGGGLGGPYGASPYGGPTGTGYAGLGGAGLGGSGGGLGGGGVGSSLYSRLPANSAAMPSSGAYPESGPYNMQSSGYPGQHPPTGSSPAPRVPPGGMYQSMPPYY